MKIEVDSTQLAWNFNELGLLTVSINLNVGKFVILYLDTTDGMTSTSM